MNVNQITTIIELYKISIDSDYLHESIKKKGDKYILTLNVNNYPYNLRKFKKFLDGFEPSIYCHFFSMFLYLFKLKNEKIDEIMYETEPLYLMYQASFVPLCDINENNASSTFIQYY